jgi:hypothetical protein
MVYLKKIVVVIFGYLNFRDVTDTNVTKVDVHKPAQRDSLDADPSKEKELLCNELTKGLMLNKPKKIPVGSYCARGYCTFHPLRYSFVIYFE